MNPAQEYYDRIRYEPTEADAFRCQTCRGARYLRYDRPIGDVLFGQKVACWACVTKTQPEPEREYEGPKPWAR